VAAICAPIVAATRDAPRNFSARTSARAAPSYANGAQTGSSAGRTV
jgi:hypothetical protein